jgi:hypothetical protein
VVKSERSPENGQDLLHLMGEPFDFANVSEGAYVILPSAQGQVLKVF